MSETGEGDRPMIIGINKRSYPAEFGAGNEKRCLADGMEFHITNIVCVLVAGSVDDYAAYIGSGSPEWVARYGDKVRFEEACCHFPGGQLIRERYRE